MSEHDLSHVAPESVALQAVALLPDEHAARDLLRAWMGARQRLAAETSAVAMELGILRHPELTDVLHAPIGTPSIIGQVPVIVGDGASVGQMPVIVGQFEPSPVVGDGASVGATSIGGGSNIGATSIGGGSNIGATSIGADVTSSDPGFDPSQIDPAGEWDVLDAIDESLEPAEDEGEHLDQQPSDDELAEMEASSDDLLAQQRAQRGLPPAPFTSDGWRRGPKPDALDAETKTDELGEPVWRASAPSDWAQQQPMQPGPSVFDMPADGGAATADPFQPSKPDVSMGPPPSSDPYAQQPAPTAPSAPYPADPYAPPPEVPPYPYPYPYPDPTTDPYAAAYEPVPPPPPAPYVAPPQPTGERPFKFSDLAGRMKDLRVKIPPGPESYDGQWRMAILFMSPDPAEYTANGYVMETSYSADGQPFQFPMWRLVTEAQADADTAEIASTGDLSMAGTSIGAAARPRPFVARPVGAPAVTLVTKRRVNAAPVPSRALSTLPRRAVLAPVVKITRQPGQTIAHVRLPDGRTAAHVQLRPIPMKLAPLKPGGPLVAKIIPGKITPGHVPANPYDRQWRKLNEWTPPSPADRRYRYVQRSTTRGVVWRFIPLLARTHARVAAKPRALARGIVPVRIAGASSGASIGGGSSIGDAHCGATTCSSVGYGPHADDDAPGGGASVGGGSSIGSNVCGGAATGSSTCGAATAQKPASMPAASGGPYLDGAYGSGGYPPTSARVKDSTDALADPLYQDPRVRIPSSLMTAPEHVLYQDAIVGAYATIGASCLSSDRHSSMEEFWRRREAIVGGTPMIIGDGTPTIIGAGDSVAEFGRALGNMWDDITHPGERRRLEREAQRDAARARAAAEAAAAAQPKPSRVIVVAPTRPTGKTWTPNTRPSGATRPGAPAKPIARPMPMPHPAPVVPPGYACTPWQIAAAPPQYLQGRRDLVLQQRTATITPSGAIRVITQQQRRWCYPAQTLTTAQQDQQLIDVVIFVAQLEQLFAELATLDDASRWSWFLANPEILSAMMDLGWIEIPPSLASLESAGPDQWAPYGYDRGGYPRLSGQMAPGSGGSGFPVGPPVWSSIAPPMGPPQIAGCGPWRRVDPSTSPPRGMRWMFSDDRQWMCLASATTRVGQASSSSKSGSGSAGDDHGVVCGPWLNPTDFDRKIGKIPPGYYWQRQHDGRGQLLGARMCPKRATVAQLACCASCAARDAGAILVGDVWSDIGHGVAQADQWVSTNVWDRVKGIVPYGEQIDQLHQARMNLLRQAAPEFYGAPASSATDDAIRAAQVLSRAVRRGDATAKDRAVRLKEAAASGDPAARRAWFAYVRIARDDDRRIETGR